MTEKATIDTNALEELRMRSIRVSLEPSSGMVMTQVFEINANSAPFQDQELQNVDRRPSRFTRHLPYRATISLPEISTPAASK